MALPAKVARQSVKSVSVTLGSGAQMAVMAAPPAPGNSVETASFSAFGDAVKTSTPNGVPQLDAFSITLLDQGEAMPKSGDIMNITVETAYSNNIGATATRKVTSMECIVQSVASAQIESDGNHVATFEVTLLPVGGGASLDPSSAT